MPGLWVRPPARGIARSVAGGSLPSVKQGLSLRVSQHLALTPQLQQSIRLLQLSTLEMAQEVEQMLDENPFLERTAKKRPSAKTLAWRRPMRRSARPSRSPTRLSPVAKRPPLRPSSTAASPAPTAHRPRAPGRRPGKPARRRQPGRRELGRRRHGGDGARRQRVGRRRPGAQQQLLRRRRRNRQRGRPGALPVSLQDHLHDQARCLRLSDEDRAALYFLIESLNDDGYLEESLPTWRVAWWQLSASPVSDAEPQPSRSSSDRAGASHRAAMAAAHGACRCRRARPGRMPAPADPGAAQHARPRARRWPSAASRWS